MIKPLFLTCFFVAISFFAKASFVPDNNEKEVKENTAKTVTLAEFEAATGKKLNWIERIQFKRAQKLIAKGKMPPMWNAEELTEGFQVWPFLGSIFTLGILYVVMIFTAKDSNALRWAQWGALIVWTAIAVSQLILLIQGGY